MPEPASTGANRFFQKIYISANAGLGDGRATAGRLPFESARPGDWDFPVSGNAPDPFAGLENANDLVAMEGHRDYYGQSTQPMTNDSFRGEEGPLSGGRFGLNKKGIDFGESSFSRSDAKAVGSASERSYDPHVGSIEHTEVDHASGHKLSSSTDRIESGVLKKPESHQVLVSDSVVERYVADKDRRQQAALSHDHGNRRGLGQGPDNDRAGLPPPSFFSADAPGVAREGASAQGGSAPGAATQRHQPLTAGPGPWPERDSVVGDPGGMAAHETPPARHDTPVPEGTAPRPILSRSASVPSPKAPFEKMQQPFPDASAGPVMPDAIAGLAQAVRDAHVRATRQEPRTEVPSGSHAVRDDKSVRTPYVAPEPLSNRSADSDPLRDAPLPAPPRAPERNWTPPTDHHRHPDRVRPDVPPKSPAPADEPQVQIGHIDVILQTPGQGDAHKAAAASAGASGFASRYYLKGL